MTMPDNNAPTLASSTEDVRVPTDRATETEALVKQALEKDDNKFAPAKHTWLGQEKRRFDKEIDDYRKATNAALPAFVVNHSSNIIGMMQVAADTAMFMSSGKSFWELERKGKQKLIATWEKPWTMFWYPIRNLYKSAFESGFSIPKNRQGDKLNYIKESIGGYFNIEEATKRDMFNEEGKLNKLTNTMSVRSSLMGILPMTIGAVLPETSQTPEETLHEVIQRRDKPVTYIIAQVGRALWFIPETLIQLGSKALHPDQQQGIGKHKHQFIGLSFIFSGIFSMLSAFRQAKGKIPGLQQYMRNLPQVGVGFFTSVAGLLTMTGVDAEQGWKGFGFGMIMRNFFLPVNIATKFREAEQGAVPYAIGQGIFQTKNVFAVLVGGAHKSKGGEVEDRRKEAIEQIGKIKQLEKKVEGKADGIVTIRHGIVEPNKMAANDAAEEDAKPANKVEKITSAEKAMPERVAANNHHELMAAAQ